MLVVILIGVLIFILWMGLSCIEGWNMTGIRGYPQHDYALIENFYIDNYGLLPPPDPQLWRIYTPPPSDYQEEKDYCSCCYGNVCDGRAKLCEEDESGRHAIIGSQTADIKHQLKTGRPEARSCLRAGRGGCSCCTGNVCDLRTQTCMLCDSTGMNCENAPIICNP